jgi:hypothetical protein
LFKTAAECHKAQSSPEAKQMAEALRAQQQSRAPEKVYVQVLCLPLDSAGEKID